MIPEKPKLRALEFVPVELNGKRYLYVKDPLGVVPEGIALPISMVPILQLLDGTRDVKDVQYGVFRMTGQLLSQGEVEAVIGKLDELFILESENFSRRLREVVEEFSREPVRKPILAGRSYPEDPEELRTFVKGIVSRVQELDIIGDVVGIVAPHIEIRLGERCYGLSYKVLQGRSYDLVVVIGTGHSLHGISLCTKDFETPLGVLKTDRNVVGKVVEELGSRVVENEVYHRWEHSIEIQLIFVKYVLGDVPIVPIIAGFGFEEAKSWKPFSKALGEAVAGRRVLFIASVDLSHMGPRYGDPSPMDVVSLSRMSAEDRELLSLLEELDQESFLEHFERDRNRRKVCGFSPLFLFMDLVKGSKGKILDYAYANMDGMGSVVSFASMAFVKES